MVGRAHSLFRENYVLLFDSPDLAGGDGVLVNQTEGVHAVHRGEEDLPLHQVAVVLQELHLDVAARAVAHDDHLQGGWS